MARPLLFFDLDGTLLDVADRHYRVYDRITRAFGGRPAPQAEYWRLKRAGAPWSQLLHRSRVPGARLADFLSAFADEIEQPAELARDTLIPGALDTLRRLRAEGYVLHLVSLRRSSVSYRRQIGALGLAPFFAETISGHGPGRPDEVKANLIAQRARRGASIMIGDTEADVLAGRRLGMATVAVASGIRDSDQLRALRPDCLLGSVVPLPDVLGTLPAGR